MRIGQNITALRGHNYKSKIEELRSKSMAKLSMGKRIIDASSDAAGLGISEKMNAQIRGLKQGGRNCQDGMSMLNTVEGVLQETTSILQRIREISVQACSDVYTTSERSKIQVEINQLTTELDRISETTKFNGRPLLDGSAQGIALQIGANAGEILTLDFKAVDSKTLKLDALNVEDHANATAAVESLDEALDSLMEERSTVGSMINRLEYTYSNINTMLENITAAESRISDVDMAQEVMELTRLGILSQSSNSMLSQAMQAPQSVLQLLQQ